jgi:serine phosphatase RsbU (regulator of sigma subunit)
MSRFLLASEVQPFLDALAGVAGGAVLLDPTGDLVWQAGDQNTATLEIPVRCGQAFGTLLLPPAAKGLGELAVAALERMASARASIDAMARATRRLWWEQNLVFSAGGLLRHGFGDRDIARWLVERLAVMEPQAVVVLTWDGVDLEIAEGALPAGLSVGDRLPVTRIAAQVLDTGEPLAFSAPAGGPQESELEIPLQPDQACMLVPLRSADRVLGVVMMVRRSGERPFGAEEVKLVQLLSDLASVALANLALVEEAEHTARLVRELELAAEIQRQLFPPPAARYGRLEVAAHCQPVTQVGGDGFLQRRLRSGLVALAVVDLTGHGIGVALALAALYARLDALADAVASPAELLEAVNGQLTGGEFNCFTMATAVVAFVDSDTGAFTLATAAHPRAIVRRVNGEIEVLDKSGLPLGVKSGGRYPLQEGRLESGDLLLLFTDGISEAIGEGAAPFGLDGLHRVIAETFDSAAEVVDAIGSAVAAFTAGVPPVDDRTIMVVRRAEGDSG